MGRELLAVIVWLLRQVVFMVFVALDFSLGMAIGRREKWAFLSWR